MCFKINNECCSKSETKSNKKSRLVEDQYTECSLSLHDLFECYMNLKMSTGAYPAGHVTHIYTLSLEGNCGKCSK